MGMGAIVQSSIALYTLVVNNSDYPSHYITNYGHFSDLMELRAKIL